MIKSFLAVTLVFFSVFSLASAEWQVPSVPPPGDDPNVFAPLNTGAVAQTKDGDLTVGPVGNLFVTGAGLFSNGLGMIASDPAANFILKNTAGLLNPAWGKVLMANDSLGTATWVATSTLGLGGGGGGGGTDPWTRTGINIYPTTLTDNVGIGTASPIAKLHATRTGTGPAAVLEGPGSGSFWLQFSNDAASPVGYLGYTQPGGLMNGLDANSMIFRSQAALYLMSNANSSNYLALKGGNVGVGVDPLYKLHVQDGAIGARGASSYFISSPGVNGRSSFVMHNVGTNVGTIQNDAANVWSLGTKTTTDNTLGTPVLSWTSTGRVGVGRTDPISPLHVKGNGQVMSVEGTSNAYIKFYPQGTGGSYTGYVGYGSTGVNPPLYLTNEVSTGYIHLSTNGGRVDVIGGTGMDVDGSLTVTGSASKTGGGSWSVLSDERLKKNIVTIPNALEKLLSLHGVNYEWKKPAEHGNLSGTQTGLIAQEVEKVFPQWVGTDASGYKNITINGFEGLTVEAFRDQQEQITKQQAEINALKKLVCQDHPTEAVCKS